MRKLLVCATAAVTLGLGMVVYAYKAASELLPPDLRPPAPATATTKAKPVAQKTMRPFLSEQELTSYLLEMANRRKAYAPTISTYLGGVIGGIPLSMQFEAAPAPSASPATRTSDSITNVQHAGVDEGGIVKLHGDYLVILRRGRLFTVSIAGGALNPISAVDAFGPGMDPHSTWYDEMLVSSDMVAVIGYSYDRGGTEVGLFHIDRAGNLTYQSTYQLRSNDYYSSRNYASRLIGNKLIFYSSRYLANVDQLPAVRKWHPGADSSDFHRIISAARIYRPAADDSSSEASTLHTVTVCDLTGGGFNCKATSVIGPPGRVFYVSPHSVYVWVTDWRPQDQKLRARSMLYRMPLDGSAPTALQVSGSPVDQFSFLESEDAHLNVLVRADAYGDGMWHAEGAAGSMALMRIPLSSFSDGSTAAPLSAYRKLAEPKAYAFQNRFVGDYLLYGGGSGWGDPQRTQQSYLYVVPWAGGDSHKVLLSHGVDRIEPMGSGAVVVGTDGKDLHFTSVALGAWPEVKDDYMRSDASQGELRSHGFFYKPDAEDSGMLGLPIALPARPDYRHLVENSAAILFLKNDSLHLREMGELEAGSGGPAADGCRASCVDWYGNARPLFVRGRVIALLGYELVEGRVDGMRISEMRRIDYGQQVVASSQRLN